MDLSPVLIKPDRTDNSTRTASCLGIELLFTCNVLQEQCFSIWKRTEQIKLGLASKQSSSSYLSARCQELFFESISLFSRCWLWSYFIKVIHFRKRLFYQFIKPFGYHLNILLWWNMHQSTTRQGRLLNVQMLNWCGNIDDPKYLE